MCEFLLFLLLTHSERGARVFTFARENRRIFFQFETWNTLHCGWNVLSNEIIFLHFSSCQISAMWFSLCNRLLQWNAHRTNEWVFRGRDHGSIRSAFALPTPNTTQCVQYLPFNWTRFYARLSQPTKYLKWSCLFGKLMATIFRI